MGDAGREDDTDLEPDVERASEIDDLTGEVAVPSAPAEHAASGSGDGDLVDPDDAERGDDPSGSADPAGPVGDGDGAAADGLADELHDLEETVEHDIHDVETLLAERDQFKDIALRLQADFDNYRKRVSAQVADEVDRATGRLVEALLPVLDAAEAAYVRHPDEVGPLLNAMLGELRKQGLETLDIEGQPFDPNLAEAVAHEDAGGGEATVAEVLRSGYRWKGRTLRPAMVRTRD